MCLLSEVFVYDCDVEPEASGYLGRSRLALRLDIDRASLHPGVSEGGFLNLPASEAWEGDRYFTVT